ncbi:terminase gpA endonuclease subunit [Pantoea agglomerans]|uniref:terminase gpA endonuclease subunit n=1 Tax=Enterobacter agglomerans TaxID=549 RepID=UPI003C7E667E
MNKDKLTKILNRAVQKIRPPKKLKPSDWCEANLTFPDGPMAQQKLSLFQFQKEVLDIITDPSIRKVVMQSSAQLLKTTVMLNAAMYFMANDNSNMAFASSTGKEVKLMKTGKFDNVVSRSSILKNIVTDKNDKNFANNADQTQMIDGSFLYWLNLNAASTLRGKTIKRLFLDEVSNISADGEEGNPLRLAEQRANTFIDGLVMVASTPKLKDDLICTEYQLSDQRKYYVPCPHCEHEHELLWENVRFDWKTINGGKRAIPDEDTAALHCPECDKEITEAQRIRMVKLGKWVITNPDVKDVAGFFISRLYSPITTIRRLVGEFAQAHFEFNLMSFYNNSLALPWDDEMNAELDSVLLENLRDSSFDIKSIPDDVLAVTHGIDQQLDRLEVTTIGFSEKNVYVLDHRAFYAPDCTKPGAKAYTELDNFLNATLTTVSGRKVKVLGSFIDSSNGNATATIYRFAGSRKNVVAIKGSSSVTSDLFKQSRTGGHELLMLNVNEGKNTIRRLLNGAVSEERDEMPTQLHFTDGLPDDYFEQLTAEELKRKGDNLYWVLKKGYKRNESLDCLNYALIAKEYYLNKLGAQPYKKLREYVSKQRNTVTQKDKYTEEQPKTPKTANTSRRKSNNWFS